MDDSLDFSMSQKEFPAMRTPSRSALRVGNKVEASYRGQGKFYPGVISADGGDGTFDVDYNDGEKEAGVSRDLIRRVGATPTAANDLAVGDAVEARYRGKGKYYPGRIGAVGGDGTFNVDYDDGEKETGVGRDLIRRVGAAPAVASANDLAVGDLVEARYKGKGKFYAGRIGAVGGDGTYNVDYDDGEKESGVARALIRKFGGAPAAAPAAGDLAVGDVVEANYRGKGKFYAGKIGAVGGDGTYSLDYDDGEKESRVRRDLIRKVGSSTAAPAASDLAVGDAVEANYRGKGKFYAGRIRTVGGDGTYAVDYDDGEKGVGVAREMIRKMGAAPAAAAPADDLAVGDAVEARYRGKSKFYAGRIAVVGGDGTYSVDYDDGEKESRVERELIKKTGGAPAAAAPAAPANDLAVGDAVEARYRGKAKFYAGRIRAVGGDGTYSIDYDDGEKETGVTRELIKKTGGAPAAVEDLAVGDAVEARYRGKAKFYAGRIRAVGGDGTYSVDYDDGEKETGVARELIKKTGGAPAAAAPAAPADDLAVGDAVEARYRGKAKFYAGRIRAVGGDGKYSIDYDDGEKETGVARELIKKTGGAPAAAAPAAPADDLAVGDAVEARYRGKAKFYAGRVRAVGGDGTYSIDYDDGEKETGVTRELIKKTGGAPAAVEDLAVGDAVEARYRGKAKFYAGRIRAVGGDGTYSVDYDDGEKETGVARELIKKTGGAPAAAAPAAPADDLAVGDAVEARYRGKAKFYAGRIRAVGGDGTYSVDYDDEEKETGVTRELIKKTGGAPAAVEDLAVGDAVEARYRGKAKFYAGRIRAVGGDGTYSVDYDDEEKETGVTRELIKKTGGAPAAVEDLAVGDAVEARYRGKAKFYAGRIRAVGGDGTYSVDYDDGEKETGVARELIKKTGGAPAAAAPAAPADDLAVGDAVEARYRGKAKFYAGRIRAVGGDGTYSVDYDDEEKETGVTRELIKKTGGAPAAVEDLAVGDAVEARYRGKAKFYAGRIRAVGGDGTYSVDYDDGEKETGVARELIKKTGGAPAAAAPAAPADDLAVGDAVEARYRGKAKFYAGRIRAVGGDGKYSIDYDDGEKETGVARELIKKTGGAPAAAAPAAPADDLAVGDAVEARYRGKAKFYAGRVRAVGGDGTYSIDYDDGEKETGVTRELIKKTGGAPAAVEDLAVGDAVEARYRGKAKFYAGRIRAVGGDGTYSVDYDDGEKETGVARELIKKTGGAPAAAAPAAPADDLAVGDAVEARYRGKAKFYAGRIRAVGGDGTYSVDYDDEEKETGVTRELIKKTGGAPAAVEDLAVGDAVEARYRGKAKFYAGRIRAVGGDGTYSVDYDDGEKETGVARELIKKTGGAPAAAAPAAPADDLAVGDAVEARYRGKAKFYAGRIRAVGGDGTYSVDYDDGEKETGVTRELIKKTGGAPAAVEDLAVGDAVEARYRGKAKFYAGRIRAVGGDGTYSVDYDDGEKETGVARELIKKTGDAPAAAAPAAPADDLAVGDAVEARYRGKAKFYAGRIRAVGGDGTYSVDYDDGEKETGVTRELIKKTGGAPAAVEDLAVGDAVEARYRGKAKFYAGRIRAVGGDGTYSVDYDDGEKETGVARELIKKTGGAPAAAAPAAPADDLAVGDAVEARYRGKAKFYAGRIRAVGGDGTYSVDYDDGEKETGVARELIKKTGGAPAAAAPAAPADDLAVGDAVEARYRGKAKFYAGRIRAVGGDGTYSVDYEDGEEEAGVARELIRKQEGGGLAVAAAQLEPVARAASPAAAAPVAVAPLSQVKAKNALFAAAARLKSQDEAVQGSSRVTAENLAAAAVEVEASMDVAAAAGLEAAAAAVRQQGLDAAQRHLAEATADVQSSVRDALRLASGDVDGGLESAAATLANDARADVARAVAPPSDDDEAPPSPPRPRPGGGLPWADGVESRESVHANRSLRSARGRPGGRQDVSRMQRMLAARSVDFGASKPRRSADKRDETFKRLTAEPKKRDRTNLDRFGSLSDAKNCVFQPVTRGDPSGEDKVAAPGRDADDDAGARANNFVQRQDAWGTKVRGEKAFAIGKKAYDQRLDKKRCPCCTAVQSYDEFEEKRMKCVDCGVDYQKANAVTLDHFLARQSEATRRAAARRTALDRAAAKLPRGSKQIYADGRVTTAPLFGAATAGGWDSFQDRMDLDQQRRARHGQREYEDDFNGSSTPGRRAASPLHRTAEPKSNFDDRTAGDVQRRQAKTERWLREDRECKKWFHHQQPGLREPHFHHNDPRTIPDAKW